MLVAVVLLLSLVSCNQGGETQPVPEGMKLASQESSPYYLYLPENWVVTHSLGACGGYTSDGSNVNVSIFAAGDIGNNNSEQTTAAPDAQSEAQTEAQTNAPEMNSRNDYIDRYWEMCWKTYTNELNGFSVIEDGKELKLGGLEAKQYVYTANYEGVEYKMQMTVTYSGGLMYILTYTAKTENYKTHLEEVEKIISEFKF